MWIGSAAWQSGMSGAFYNMWRLLLRSYASCGLPMQLDVLLGPSTYKSGMGHYLEEQGLEH